MSINLPSLEEQYKKAAAQQASSPTQNTSPSASSNSNYGEQNSQSTEAITYSSVNSATETPTAPTTQDNGLGNIDMLSDTEVDSAYAAWRAEKEAQGIKTTHMSSDKEVNFAEYAAALDDALKEELMSYFEDGALNREEALEAQQKIAGLFTGKNYVQLQDFANAVRQLGYDIEWDHVQTGYIIDDKKSGPQGGTYRENGSITIFTIKNKDGEELFKVVDSNGNAAIEVEELFLNEFLTGISNQIDKDLLVQGVGLASSYSSGSGEFGDSSSVFETSNASQNDKNKGDKAKAKPELTAGEFVKLLREGMQAGVDAGMNASKAKQSTISKLEEQYTISSESKALAAKVTVSETSKETSDKEVDIESDEIIAETDTALEEDELLEDEAA